MSRSDRDITRVVQSWLEEGVTALPDRVLDAVLDQLPATPQRRSWWSAWRHTLMNNPMRVGLAAAAVVVIAIIGYEFLSGSNVGGPGPTATPQPTATPVQSVTPQGLLEPGPFTLFDETLFEFGAGSLRVTVTIPAADWYGFDGRGILNNGSAEPPDGAGFIVFTGDLEVYSDPCRWALTRPDPPTGPTVDDLVAALSAQLMRDATAPTDITVDGYAGKAIELTVPADIDFADCDLGEFRSWQTPTAAGVRYHQGPGQHDLLWIIDVDGTRVVIDASFYEGTPAADRAEQQAILESIRFE